MAARFILSKLLLDLLTSSSRFPKHVNMELLGRRVIDFRLFDDLLDALAGRRDSSGRRSRWCPSRNARYQETSSIDIVVLMMLWWTLLRWDVRGIARDTRQFDGNRLFNRWSLMAYGSFSAFLLRERILLSCVSSSERSLVVHSPGEDRAVLGELVRAFPDRSLPM